MNNLGRRGADPSIVDPIIRAIELLDEECPGEGACHGCLSWCDACGDVDEICDAPVCFQHRCLVCNKLFSQDEHEYAYATGGYPSRCFPCEIEMCMRTAIKQSQDEIVCGEECRRHIGHLIGKPLAFIDDPADP